MIQAPALSSDQEEECRPHSRRQSQAASDEETEQQSSTKAKSRQKRRKKYGSRSIKQLDTEAQAVVEAGYMFVKKALSVETPWPVPGNGDDEDELLEMLLTAWDSACETVGVEQNPTAKELGIVSASL